MSVQKSVMKPLSSEELKALVPTAFMKAPSRELSDKYVHIPTSKVIEDLAKLGWEPVKASQRKARKGKVSQFSKHMITFQNPTIQIKGKDGDDAFPQIIVTNSHDGLSSFKFMMGIYRMVCSNGLVIADQEFSNFKIRHMGYSFEELEKTITQAVEDLPNRVKVLNDMRERILNKEEQHKLALDAMLIRAGITPGSKQASKFNYDQETLEEILEPRRKEDEGDNLWKTFNRIQEAVTQGGFHAALKGAKVRKVRKIKSFEKDLKINQELFKLASALV